MFAPAATFSNDSKRKEELTMTNYKEIAHKLRSIKSCSKSDLLHQAADTLEEMGRKLKDEMYRHDRVQDFEVAEAEQLRQMTIERNMLARKLAELERESFRWKWHYGLPAEDNRDTLLLVASGRGGNMVLEDAVVIGCYMGNSTWMLEDYPEIDDAVVKCWTTAPEVE